MNNNVCDLNSLNPCTGCAMCNAICPHNAISIKLNCQGFYMPIIDESLCSNCGICKKVCYRFDEKQSSTITEPIQCYSAVNKNTNELKMASSGAVSIELMKQCLKDGYSVVGVAYDSKKEIAETRIATAESELGQFRGSKYFQSYTADAFRKIIQDKSEQKYAIFGTPCQIYAFSKMADIMHNHVKYLFVDIFCHGCPSMNLWEKYLQYSKDKFKVSKFDDIMFRSKIHGWHEYCFNFITSSKQYSSSKYKDPFYEMFFGMDIMNEACYDCAPRSSISSTDIRVGDFWGWQFDDNIQGVSGVVIKTQNGAEIFDKVKDKFEINEYDFKEIIKAQSYGKKHVCNIPKRKKTIELLSSDLKMNQIIKTYRKTYSIQKKIKNTGKNLIKLLPVSLYGKLRKRMHK